LADAWSKVPSNSQPFKYQDTTMTTNSRRTFFIQSLSCASALTALAVASTARAQAPAAVSEADPQAMALGYQNDATKTDAKKYPNYAAGRSCSGCVLFQGKGTDATGSCAVFGNKLVARTGWCSAWTQKG
jgi:hypothetical protein